MSNFQKISDTLRSDLPQNKRYQSMGALIAISERTAKNWNESRKTKTPIYYIIVDNVIWGFWFHPLNENFKDCQRSHPAVVNALLKAQVPKKLVKYFVPVR